MSSLILLLLGMGIVVGGILLLRLHPVIVLLFAAMVVAGLTSSGSLENYGHDKKLSDKEISSLLEQSSGERVAVAFGSTCGKIGLLIILASIIGKSLLDTGAAERIVRSTVSLMGEKRVPASMTCSSFFLSGPVFFDTVFYLMIPLARAMGVRSQKSYPLYIMAIVAGGTMAHSLVPPTPGPLFVAGELGVSFGMMTIMGVLVGSICATSGMIYGSWLNKRQDIPLRGTSDASLEELQQWSTKETAHLPGITISLIPILLPVFLITGNTFLSSLGTNVPEEITRFFKMLGNPIVALSLSAVISMFLLYRHFKGNVKSFSPSLQEAIYSAGIIILITASGGAFGAMLQQTGIGGWIATLTPELKLGAIPLAFFIAAVVRTAQGSATVAMITAIGIVSAGYPVAELGFHPVYLAIAVGCGSKLFPWMNDSGFWIICKMSGFTEAETIKNFSFLLTIMGLTGLVATMILAWLLPLV